MAIEVGLVGIVFLSVILMILACGFTCYLFKNYCQKKLKEAKRTSTGPRHPGAFLETSHDTTFKTTTDEEATMTSKPMKTHTFDQILKQEERSGYSLHPLKLLQQQGTGLTVKSQQILIDEAKSKSTPNKSTSPLKPSTS